MKKVMNNEYGNEAERQSVNHYADLMVQHSNKTSFLPAITRSVRLFKEVTNMKMNQREQNIFRLSLIHI